MEPIRLVVVDPGHFHAALVQQRRDPDVSPEVRIYAPLGPELLDHLGRIARYNASPEAPTDWRLDIHAGADFLDRLGAEAPGAVAIFSGRNRGKIDRVRMAIEAGLHVLADKPVIIRRDDLPALDAAVTAARQRGLVFCDLMTGRCDPLAAALRGLAQDREVFGEPQEVALDSVHHIMKEVSGRPNLRPPWYFDIAEQGEGLADIGTHLVDRVHETLFPGIALDWRREIALDSAERWPTMLSLDRFRAVTGASGGWPDFLAPNLRAGVLEYFCNMRARYRVCGVSVALEVRWEWQAPAGGDDTHSAVYTGGRARLELRQSAAEGYRPEIYVVPLAEIATALERRIAALQATCPGLGIEAVGGGWRLAVPPALRLGHDPRFARFARRFFDHVHAPERVPPWEGPNLVAKYAVCTGAVALARG